MTPFTSPWKLPLKYLKTCAWAAAHEERFPFFDFIVPGRILVYSEFYWSLTLRVSLPYLNDPIPFSTYVESGVWTEDELKSFFFTTNPRSNYGLLFSRIQSPNRGRNLPREDWREPCRSPISRLHFLLHHCHDTRDLFGGLNRLPRIHAISHQRRLYRRAVKTNL